MATQVPIRIAIIGLGKIARGQHVPALMAAERFDLVATVDPNGGIESVPNFASCDALLAEGSSVDAVAICTPPAVRAELAEFAFEAGWHVMLEKPPLARARDADALVAHTQVAQVTAFAAWHSRMAGAIPFARDWLRGRQLTAFRIDWRENIRRWHPGQDWLLDKGGFGVFDPAVNAFSILTAIVPDRFRFQSGKMAIPEGRVSPIAAELTMRCGAIEGEAQLDFLHAGTPRWNLEIKTEDGSIVLRDGGHRVVVDGRETDLTTAEYPKLYERFAMLIAEGKSDVDVEPLRLVEEAMTVARPEPAPRFDWHGPAVATGATAD